MGAPQAKIIIRAGEFEGREFVLTAKGLQVGRSPANDIAVKDPKISKEHVRIFLRGDQFVVRDLGSSNGTAVNGAMITEKALEHEDVIAAGNLSLQYIQTGAPAGGELVPVAAQVPAPVAQAMPQSPPPASPPPGYGYQVPPVQEPQPAPVGMPNAPEVAVPRSPIIGKLVSVLVIAVALIVMIVLGQKITGYYAGVPEIPHISFHLTPFVYNVRGEPQEFENHLYLKSMSYEFATGRTENVEFAALRSSNGGAMTLDNFKNFPDLNRDAIRVISNIKLLNWQGKAPETEKAFSRIASVRVNFKEFYEGKTAPRKVVIRYLNAFGEPMELWLYIRSNPTEPEQVKLPAAEKDARGRILFEQGQSLLDSGRYFLALQSFEEAEFILDDKLCSSDLRKKVRTAVEKAREDLAEAKKNCEKKFFTALEDARKTNTRDKWMECDQVMRDINLLVPDTEEPWRQHLGIFFVEINERLESSAKQSKEQQGNGLF